MPNTFTDNTFSSTYKDDWKDSDHYNRILFNPGRALQARELTQMQTIIQEGIRKFANNIYRKDGVPVKTGGISVNNAVSFIKIDVDTNNSFDDVSSLVGVVLTGATSSIKVKVVRAVAAENSDPDTLYVQYLDDPTTRTSYADYKKPSEVTPGEVLSNGSDINLTVQTTNTLDNPAVGLGSQVEIGEASFYVNGHFVFVDKQQIFLSKYSQNVSANIGFRIVQDIVTVSDTDALYDNTNALPNRSSPGADRYRIRLILTKQSDLVEGDTFVYYAEIYAGRLVDQATSDDEGFNAVRSFVNKRIKEINGDFIKKYWKLRVDINGTNASNNLMMRIDPGVAYIQGNRVETTSPRFIPLAKATDTIVRDDPKEQIGIDYGNYYYFDSGVGMLDIDTCEQVELYAGFGGTDSVIGTANIRAITEGTTSKRVGSYTYNRTPSYKAHLFNIFRNNFNYSLRDVKSIKSASNNHLIDLVQVENNIGSILHEPNNNQLIIDTPLKRPKSFTDASMTFMKKYNFTAAGSSHTITLTDSGETFVRESDVIVASATEFAPSGVSTSIQSGNKDIIFSGLSNGVAYEVITFVKKTNASVKTKTLTETTITTNLDSDGRGIRYINLGKSDVYSIERIRVGDSDGADIFGNFLFDAGTRVTHYGDGKLLWTSGGLASQDSDVFVRFKYFSHSTNGEFFAVNSYDGQLDYLKIPAQNLKDGDKVSLRDVIDLRPATDGSGSFSGGTVFGLPTPTETIETKAEYYLPRKDKLLITKNGELQLKRGTPSLNPKYPETPADALDLYKISLNPNTLHSQDLETTLIPRKGYTMADISRLEEKVDKLEEMTTLSLLELNTKFLEVLDSSGNNRPKSGFFVDNFGDHQYSDTRSPEYRAAIDERNLYLKPTFVEDCVDMFYDSVNSNQLRTVKKEDYVMLDYNEVAYEAQDLASDTENLAPFYNPQTVGRLEISPETDTWFETEIVGESVTGKKTKFDLRHALNWNNSENGWFGVDPTSLEVGDEAAFQTGTSTSVTHNSGDAKLIGTVKTEELGEWVEVSNYTDTETLSTEVVELSRKREQEISRSVIDSGFYVEDVDGGYYNSNYVDGGRDSFGTNYNYVPYGSYGYNFVYTETEYDTIEVTTDLYDVVTAETRQNVLSTTTSTYEATKTVKTENTYEGTAEVVTTTTTSNTVNRIASSSTIRDIVGEKIIDVAVIPFMRSIEIRFKAEGLRPNTQYYPFFDGTPVGTFCREETVYRTKSELDRINAAGENDNEGVSRTTSAHSKGTTILSTDNEGSLIGSFEVPNNVSMRFHTGVREFSLLDINAHNFQGAMSFARAKFVSSGTLEKVENEVAVTRILKVVGENFNEVDRNVNVERSTWTETLIDTEIATDVKSSSTVTAIIGDTTTTTEFVESNITYEEVLGTSTTPPNHVTETGTTTPPGGTTDVVDEGETTTAYVPVVPEELNYDQDVFFYADPLAQTFLVKEESGVFLTSVRTYFSSVSTTGAPVFCEIRPTVNGVPSATKILASKKLSSSSVNVVPNNPTNKVMLQNGTDFTFDAPVYLARGEYAIVLRPGNNDPGYNCYVATIGKHQLGSTQSFISQQPTLGGFFKSQNGKLWEPASGQDLAYRISVAKFETSGNAILENVNIPPVALATDPMRSQSGSDTIRVELRGHGLRDGDKTWIRGVDSATDFGNGLTGADVNGVRTVIDYDNSGYTFQAGSSATGNKWFGGQSVTSQRNVNFEILRPELNITQPNQTDVTLSIKTATQQSLAGTETRFVKDAKYQIIENGKNNKFPTARAIYNRKTENLTGAGKLAGERSATLQVTMKTTNPLVSPIIDLQRATLDCVHTLISRQDSAATDGFNVPLTYVGERNPQNGTESAKHVTTVTTLAEEAVGLRVLLSANKPPQADFQVYYRTAGEGDIIRKSAWTLISPESTLPSDTNPNIFREYRYLVGGDNGIARPFTQFQLKIVMRSTSSAQVPTFRDLRAIALAV